MKIERDERRFDFHDIGLAIKRAREASGMTQEQLAYIVDRAPRTIMYNENDGQHPSFNTFYQMVTMFDISVDQYFYPSQNSGSECRKRIDAMLGSLDEKELKIVKYDEVYESFKSYRESRAASREAFVVKQQHKFVKAIESLGLKSANEENAKREKLDGMQYIDFTLHSPNYHFEPATPNHNFYDNNDFIIQ